MLHLNSFDTICRQWVANRIPNIKNFASSHDLIFFVSGKKAPMGKYYSMNVKR